MDTAVRQIDEAARQVVEAILDRVEYPQRAERLPPLEIVAGKYTVRFARTPEELNTVQRLRFEVFNLELQEGLDSSYLTGLDEDGFDATCHHLVATERASGRVVGTYRLRTLEMAGGASDFYSAGEFNLACLPPQVAGESVEIGRACVAREHRNTQVFFLLWRGLAAYLAHNRKRYFFGCCSLASQDASEGRRMLECLEREGHMHPTVYVPPQQGFECGEEEDALTGVDDGAPVPRLFRTYLRFGAKVCGPPAIDRAFKTIDFFVIFDTRAMDARTRRLFFEA
ncbi:MAG: GNAT family N-acetyltransferase [Rubrivivax sp.]|nr:GNAT family N-acetyltransferase [Pyrinomonadaceae bacterium]